MPPKMPESAYISKCVPREKQEANPSKFSDSMSENLPAFLENEAFQKSPAPSAKQARERVKPRFTNRGFHQASGVASPARFRRLDAAEIARERVYMKASSKGKAGG